MVVRWVGRSLADDLVEAVRALTTARHQSQAVWDVSKPATAPALAMSDDVFLYARLAVVAAGQRTWQAVLADPDAVSGRWRVADAEELLDVVPAAYRRATGLDWDDDLDFDMPLAGDGARAGAGAAGGEDKWWTWYMCGHMYDVKGERDEFDDASSALKAAIDADPAWRAWRGASGVPDLRPTRSTPGTPSRNRA
ncbi:DUF4240 domain-containing protein [Micromonospora chersina]|uniref:DUF4240 domain-containing protein n=1 Tax=Micromonospora chersina TaxID=47854 RepID=UPI003D9012B3